MVGIEVQGLHFPRLIMIDHRDRHTQVDVREGLILSVEDLNLIRAQQIEQARGVP